MDRALLADFLRARREALQPEDVGLPRGSRATSRRARICWCSWRSRAHPSDEKLQRLIAMNGGDETTS